MAKMRSKRNTKIIEDDELSSILKGKKNVLLIEPNYTRKYIPSGLGRISTYIKEENGGKTTFARSHIHDTGFDLICITSLFTYYSQIVMKTIQRAQSIYRAPILVGGVFASLMPQYIIENSKNDNIRIFKGCSKLLDGYPIDYNMNWKVTDEWNNFSYAFTTRGCPNRCHYCAVWRIENPRYIENWKNQVDPQKSKIAICDNNLLSHSMEHIEDVMNFIKRNKLSVLFDGGFDCKFVTEDIAKMLKGMKFARSGIRIGFDRIEEDGVFQRAAELLKKYASRGNMLAYVLYNFKDTPQEAEYRMRECDKLNIRPYPQRYISLNALTKEEKHYIGVHWSDSLANAFRCFWQTPRLFKHGTFGDFIKQRETQIKFNLNEKSIALYNEG